MSAHSKTMVKRPDTSRRNVERNTKHGLRSHPLYGTWKSMKQRCCDSACKSFEHYGARGITVCEEWANDFAAFYEWARSNGWEPGLEIDRINNDEGYLPTNCRFVTRQINSRNRRSTKLSPDDVREIRASNLTQRELAKAYGIGQPHISSILLNKAWKGV